MGKISKKKKIAIVLDVFRLYNGVFSVAGDFPTPHTNKLQLRLPLHITLQEKIFPIKNSIGELAYPIAQNKDTRSAA